MPYACWMRGRIPYTVCEYAYMRILYVRIEAVFVCLEGAILPFGAIILPTRSCRSYTFYFPCYKAYTLSLYYPNIRLRSAVAPAPSREICGSSEKACHRCHRARINARRTTTTTTRRDSSTKPGDEAATFRLWPRIGTGPG